MDEPLGTDGSCSGALPRRPWEWLTVFGPGAIIASLTIGTGELVFSSRGGAIFGYRILFLFVDHRIWSPLSFLLAWD
jgi:Mn2+/Fe2+ NRAMP family transporter